MTRDLRKYARNTNARLIAGGILITFIVGLGLIYVFYGPAAAVSGLICLVAGISPLALIGLAFVILEFIVKRANRDEA